ncbi:hypothetical protein HS088_TW22G01225 [Tripterygium wilfordii]|uniref:Uncharacterized protein n=1 Tax=Tripterygium wilfordii TaxID=458696 RepID=A0A7J7C044_TRIWF|nr:hypothetical protein HS088_TW22G01225 [Tripterygium wilfordii]
MHNIFVGIFFSHSSFGPQLDLLVLLFLSLISLCNSFYVQIRCHADAFVGSHSVCYWHPSHLWPFSDGSVGIVTQLLMNFVNIVCATGHFSMAMACFSPGLR